MSLLDLYDTDNDLDPDMEGPGKWPSGFWTQYSQLTIRTFRQSRRRVLCKGTVLQNFLICLVVCLIFFQLPRTEETLRDRMGAVFFIAAHWGFTPLFDAVTSCRLYDINFQNNLWNIQRSSGHLWSFQRLWLYLILINTLSGNMTAMLKRMINDMFYTCCFMRIISLACFCLSHFNVQACLSGRHVDSLEHFCIFMEDSLRSKVKLGKIN